MSAEALFLGLKDELVTGVQVPEAPQATTKRLESYRCSTSKRLQQAKISQSIQSIKRRRPASEFKVGDLVMLSTKNLPLATAYRRTAPEFIGPIPITKAFYATDNYTVTRPNELNIQNTFHVEHLKPYIPNDDARFPNCKNTKPRPLPEFDDEDTYEVELIVREIGNPKTGEIFCFLSHITPHAA